MSDGEIYGPLVRWFNPFRVKVRLRHDGWSAMYPLRNGSAGVTGCESRREAILACRRSVTVRLRDLGDRFEKVTD
jgi:hypothetical protein